MIGEIKEAALNIKLDMKPEYFMSDFELASINAFSYHFPNLKTSGCYFHFAQSLYRKISGVTKYEF